jgi:hypothetical protein
VRVPGQHVADAEVVGLEARFRLVDAAATVGSVDVEFTIENRGNIRLDIDASVSAADADGNPVAPPGALPSSGLRDLLPGNAASVSLTIDEVPASAANVVVTLTAVDPEGEVVTAPTVRSVALFTL